MEKITRKELKIFLTVLLVMGLFVQWYGVNSNSRFDLALSTVNDGTPKINEYHWHAGDRSYYKGDYYSDKEPGMGMLATPIYGSWKTIYGVFGDTSIDTENRSDWFTTNNETLEYMNHPGSFYLSSLILVVFLTSTLALSLLSVLIYRLSGDFLEDERKRILLTFGFAFGTILTHYGANFLPNAVVTLLSFTSFYIIYRKDNLNPQQWVGAGFIGGFAVVVDPTAAPVLGASFLYALMKFDYIPYYYVVGGFLGGLPMMVYNTLLFGYPWMLPRFFLDPALYPNLQQASSVMPQIGQQGFRLEIQRLFFTSVKLLFYPYRGIFYWFPVLVLSLLGLKQLYQEQKKVLLVLAVLAPAIVLMVGGWWAWWMGGFFGARYLSVLVPFLMFPLFLASRKINIKIITVLVGISIVVNLAGFHGYYEDGLKDLANSSEMKEEYQDQVESFETLGNPVKEYYLQGLLYKGPQSRILNGLYNGDLPPDIRSFNSYEERAPLPILLWTLLLIVGGIWNREIREKLRKHRENVIRQ